MVSAFHVIALVLSGVLLHPVVLRTSGFKLPNFIRVREPDVHRLIIPAECRQEIRQVRSVLECSVLCGQLGFDCVAFIAYIHTNRLVSCEMFACWFERPQLVEVTPIPALQLPTLQLPYQSYIRGITCVDILGPMWPAGKHCYKLSENYQSSHQAAVACLSRNMKLAEPDTVQQAHALLAWLELQDLDKDVQVWTYLFQDNGALFMSDGTKLSSQLWASGQPDDDDRCVTAMKDADKYRFNDFPCSDTAYYVCEENVITGTDRG